MTEEKLGVTFIIIEVFLLIMVDEIVPYQRMKLEDLAGLPEEQLLDIAYDMLKYCNHTVQSMSHDIQATLAKCDAMDKTAELYRSIQSQKKYNP